MNDILFNAVIQILHWVIALIPIAVFGIASKTIAIKGFEQFKSLGSFVRYSHLQILPHPRSD